MYVNEDTSELLMIEKRCDQNCYMTADKIKKEIVMNKLKKLDKHKAIGKDDIFLMQ